MNHTRLIPNSIRGKLLAKAHDAGEIGATQAKKAFEKAHEMVAETMESHEEKPLSLPVAAEESGYSEGHLRRLVADGTLEDVGNGDGPRIRRKDLPKKPGA